MIIEPRTAVCPGCYAELYNPRVNKTFYLDVVLYRLARKTSRGGAIIGCKMISRV